jgi:hypothetical protein
MNGGKAGESEEGRPAEQLVGNQSRYGVTGKPEDGSAVADNGERERFGRPDRDLKGLPPDLRTTAGRDRLALDSVR